MQLLFMQFEADYYYKEVCYAWERFLVKNNHEETIKYPKLIGERNSV